MSKKTADFPNFTTATERTKIYFRRGKALKTEFPTRKPKNYDVSDEKKRGNHLKLEFP